ncbi:isoprenoid synthase domain-containing protein [Favolaschia claudopus]|uniref:(2E,6E)-farnesyl diphosphate synthase n=1 Tax=Favolaschia claudopus TaxID=2862362 RepID=A0AAW0AZJ2_9AGAR
MPLLLSRSTQLELNRTQLRDEAAVLEPFSYITTNSGKNLRTQLMTAFNGWINVPEDKLAHIAKVVSLLHNASLMIDDIEDDSQLRRGEPVAHKIYGIPQTINAANYVFFLAYQELLTLSGPSDAKPSQTELVAIITSELMSLHRGQGLELLWRDSLTCPSEDQYVRMVNDSGFLLQRFWMNHNSFGDPETGGLLRIGVKLLMACGTTNLDVDYIPLVNLIGVHFQIRDDYMNLQSGEYTSNKGFAEDLTEGKFSFPIVHGINADKTNRQLLNTLQKRPRTPTLKTHAISYLDKKTGSFAYTRSVLTNLEQQVRDEIARLGGNKRLEAIVDALSLQNATLDSPV